MSNQKLKLLKWDTFFKILLISITCIAAALALFYLARLILRPNRTIPLIGLLITLTIAVITFAIQKARYPAPKTGRDSLYRFFFEGLKVIIIITLAVGLWFVWSISRCKELSYDAFFKAIAVGIIVIWTCVFLAYFVWAIYFYNINMGLTEQEWDKINQAKENKRMNNHYIEDDLKEPEYNPYHEQTFGLPPGTVRGMIAFTLLFGALALLLVSIGMKNEIDPDSIIWDQYEFFKTAFLMMIAFYFGSKSLEILKGKDIKPPLGAPPR